MDQTVNNLSTILTCGFIVLVAGAIAFIPVLIAWSRRHRYSEGIVAVAMLWGLCTVLSVASTTLASTKYEHEHELQIESGYYDPTDVSDAPTKPWLTWAALGAGYCALIGWAAIPGRASSDEAASK